MINLSIRFTCIISCLILSRIAVAQSLQDTTTKLTCKSIKEALVLPEKVGTLELRNPRKVSKKIKRLKNLEELTVRLRGRLKLPKEVGSLKQLKTLSITGNQDSKLKPLPSEIGELTALQQLRIWNVDLEVLPPEIGSLQNLEKLELFANDLQSIPQEITQLKNLTKIGLDSNRDLDFQDAFEKLATLPKLSYLNINYYPHETLPSNVVKLEGLEVISIWGTKSTKLNLDHALTYFAQLKKLKLLKLSGLPLTAEEKDKFEQDLHSVCPDCKIEW